MHPARQNSVEAIRWNNIVVTFRWDKKQILYIPKKNERNANNFFDNAFEAISKNWI